MTALWTAKALAAATGGEAIGDFIVDGVAFDSREVGPGDLFVALKGEQSDGHRFVDNAVAAGAAAAVVSSPIATPHLLVADTTQALNDIAIAARARVDAKIIGVTGSVGKTGTKEALYAALNRASHGHAHRSVKSYNNHVGVPLSLSRMPADTAFGVFEMGMNHAGELSALTQLVKPDVAIITAIAPAHIEYLGSIEAIADAKAEIFEGLMPGGTAIIPADSPQYLQLRKAAARFTDNIVAFGFDASADVRAVDIVPALGGGSLVTAEIGPSKLCFTVAEPGRHWVSNALAILAAVDAAGSDLASAGLALAELQGIAGRGARHDIVLADGGTALLIDESYNANPVSMAAALDQLAQQPAKGRRIAILGAMGELGDHAERYHHELGEQLAKSNIDLAILVGDNMRWAAEASHPVETQLCSDTAAALAELQAELGAGDVVLIKGSNYLGLGRIVEALRREIVA
ncbi:MAG: UDP-N-acetylmuramoyl-tripeptide--D-alanyl-D-alanine ligase [Parasphingorhabdus sp.]|nr:UDP-N-acetylmuramoyl-tripeptide--D-alanyl-D-alanine ligase [Parasphingorhabdus sp.]